MSGPRRWRRPCAGVLLAASLAIGCGEPDEVHWGCTLLAGETPPFAPQIGCEQDFLTLASEPTVSSITGARSIKTSVDREADFALSFQDSRSFPIHWDFLFNHRSAAQGLPRVPALAAFNASEYYLPDRRFLLGALTHYEGPDAWVYEISPYDTADAAQILTAFDRIKENTYVGPRLRFHPTSLNVEAAARELPRRVPLISTEELFSGSQYQALNVAESIGRLRFVNAAELEDTYITFRDIVVLDNVPNDISVTQGIITAEFQTPLSHINVLSRNRGTPNMALAGAMTDPLLRSLDGEWVHLVVGATSYEITRVEAAEADAYWEANKPASVQVPGLDNTVTELRDVGDIVPADTPGDQLRDRIREQTRAFGGKAANYAALSHAPGVNVPKGFAVPVFYYRQFMQENGFDARVAALLADAAFRDDPGVRDQALLTLRGDMLAAPVNAGFADALMSKLASEYEGIRMRFRSSTNAEDLDGFTGAGLYTSNSADEGDREDVLDAVKQVWSSIWFFRAFEERSFRSIDHTQVGMALLVHRSFPNEEANGVALTNNPFDPAGLEPAFFVNVQVQEFSVVQPPPGTVTESFLHYFDVQNRPVSYLSESNLVPAGQRVLSPAQVDELGVTLDAIRQFFTPAYSPAPGSDPWWAMDVEFKFDGEEGEPPSLFVKQARPFGNR